MTRAMGLARRSIAETQRGQAVVELAVALSFLMLLVMVVVDFSPVVARGAQLTQATGEGASFGRRAPARTTSEVTAIKERVKAVAPSLALADAQITITCQSGLNGADRACSTAWFGDSITVQATYTYRPFTGQIIGTTGAEIVLTRSATQEII